MLVTIAGEQRLLWPLEKEANWLLFGTIALVLIGMLAVGSASVEYAVKMYDNAFAFVQRYLFHLALGLLAAIAAYRVPMHTWQRTGWIWLCRRSRAAHYRVDSRYRAQSEWRAALALAGAAHAAGFRVR